MNNKIINTRFYKQMLSILADNNVSERGLAKMCDLSYGTIINFFDTSKKFSPLRYNTMAKLNKYLGIELDVMEEYNQIVEKKGDE